jgi:hypothetical protein
MNLSRSRLPQTLRWTRSSYYLRSAFLAVIALIIVVWWPLAEEYLGQINPATPIWMQVDWLLIGLFLVMSVLIMMGADVRTDAWIVLVATVGGLTIEAWGTQTLLWTYYTSERPPLWIVPAWPIATLAIDRITRLLNLLVRRVPEVWMERLFLPVLGGFYAVMIYFTRRTLDKPFTLLALLLCALIILSPGGKRNALLIFAAGAGLGYFLELWGTTRECWIYYTRETPPVFAVLAHGMAALAFARTGALVYEVVIQRGGARWMHGVRRQTIFEGGDHESIREESG